MSTTFITPDTGRLTALSDAPSIAVQDFRVFVTPDTARLGLAADPPRGVSTSPTITPGSGAIVASGEPSVEGGSPGPAPIVRVRDSRLSAISAPSELNVDGTVQYAAEQFEVALTGSQPYLGRVSTADIATGLLDASLAPDLVDHINNGFVDEIELHVDPNKLTSVVRGRDAAAFAIDTTVYVTYSIDPTQPVAPEIPKAVPGFPSLPVIVGITVPQIIHAQWTASMIARDLCRRVGLSLAWQTQDYYLRETITVNGPVMQTIQNLVEPFSHFEPSKTDIWIDPETKTLYVRARGGLTPPNPALSLSVHDTRIQNLMARATFQGFVRVLRILGSATGTGLFAVDPGTKDVENTDETVDPVTLETLSRIVTKETIRILDNACLSQSVTTYLVVAPPAGTITVQGPTLKPVSIVATVSDWDPLSIVFPNQIINSPKENSRVITTTAADPDTGILGPVERTTVLHSYDAAGFLSAQTTRKETWDSTATPSGPTGWSLDSLETKQYRDNGAGMYQITTSQFGSDGTPGDIRRTTANGTRPGGPGRGVSGNASSGQQVVFATLISQAQSAKDITINNRSLLPQHMTIIAQQARDWSGSTEVEVTFTAAGMPWIKRGMYVQLTGLVAEDGATPIPFLKALVTEARVEYRESSDQPTYQSYVKCVYWAQEGHV